MRTNPSRLRSPVLGHSQSLPEAATAPIVAQVPSPPNDAKAVSPVWSATPSTKPANQSSQGAPSPSLERYPIGLADFTGRKLDRSEQDAVAAGYGLLSTLVGIQALLFPILIESAWEGYSVGEKTRASETPRLLRIGGRPLPEGGASVGFNGIF